MPPSAGASPSVPSAPAVLPPHGRRCGSGTAARPAMAAWVRPCQGTTGARASTGVDGLPLYALLERAGCQGLRGDPRQGQRAPTRPQTAVHACQGLPRLPSRGRLTAACRPAAPPRVWRASQRPRATLRADAGRHVQRLAQALEQRHVTRPAGGSDRTGRPGRRLVRAIVPGARAPQAWATRRAPRCKARAETMAPALPGTWQPEPRCACQPSLALDEDDHEQIRGCARVIAAPLQGMAGPAGPPLAPRRRGRRRQDHAVPCAARPRLHPVTGVDLPAMAGIEERPALVVLRALGTDRSRWPRATHGGRWRGLAPHPKQSGGQGTARATRPGGHRAAPAWRLAAQPRQRSQRALGAFVRRIAARRGVAPAITATAYKLARMVYARLKHGMAYVAQGLEA